MEIALGYVLFGHGTLTPASSDRMEWCALDPGTTIQFFADAGQSLMHEPKDVVAFENLQRPFPRWTTPA
jgi:hypothetical protein